MIVRSEMKKLLWVIIIVLMVGIIGMMVHAFAKDCRSYQEPLRSTEHIDRVICKSNAADLVRIRAEITKRQPEEMTEAEPETETESDRWCAKAAEYQASEEIVAFLFNTLEDAGIEQMMPYAMAQIFQESRFIETAETKLDKGILQYRITYWSAVCREHGFPEDTSIFDWKTQIRIYAADMARRLASGISIEETISRHKQSDYGPYDAAYVAQVMRWVR